MEVQEIPTSRTVVLAAAVPRSDIMLVVVVAGMEEAALEEVTLKALVAVAAGRMTSRVVTR